MDSLKNSRCGVQFVGRGCQLCIQRGDLMKIKTRCDNCGKVYNMASEYAGRTAQCKRCQSHFVMNPYTPPPADIPGQPEKNQPAPNPRPQTPPAPPSRYIPPDQTILPNAGAGPAYAVPPPPQFSHRPEAEDPYQLPPQGFQQAQPPAGLQAKNPLHPGAGTQTALCLKCGHSVEIPTPTRNMKISCQACGAKIAVGPAARKKMAGGGGGSSRSTLILLLLLLLLAGGLFLGPMFLPEIFPDIIGSLLP